jgi:hypothetical protein
MVDKCVRCESLERPQKSKTIHYIPNDSGDKIPVCSVCILEIKEEEEFLKSISEDGSSEEFD